MKSNSKYETAITIWSIVSQTSALLEILTGTVFTIDIEISRLAIRPSQNSQILEELQFKAHSEFWSLRKKKVTRM